MTYQWKSYWREQCAPIIAKVIAENRGKDEKEIRKALHDAYPFGERRMHPYKIWCSEVNIQLGKRKLGKPVKEVDPNQIDMFQAVA